MYQPFHPDTIYRCCRRSPIFARRAALSRKTRRKCSSRFTQIPSTVVVVALRSCARRAALSLEKLVEKVAVSPQSTVVVCLGVLQGGPPCPSTHSWSPSQRREGCALPAAWRAATRGRRRGRFRPPNHRPPGCTLPTGCCAAIGQPPARAGGGVRQCLEVRFRGGGGGGGGGGGVETAAPDDSCKSFSSTTVWIQCVTKSLAVFRNDDGARKELR